jgi:hypothetical protein
MCGSDGVRSHLTGIKKRGDNVPDAVQCGWHAMRHTHLTSGRAVLCADQMDSELEDPRYDEEQRGGRTRLGGCEHGQAKLRDGLERLSVCPLRRGTSSLRGLCGVSMCSSGRQPVQAVVAPVRQQGCEWELDAG